MNNSIKNLVIFLAGATIGGGISYLYFRNDYEERYQEEIQSIKEAFSNRYSKKVAYPTDESGTSNEELKKQLNLISNDTLNAEELQKQLNLIYTDTINTEKYNYAGVDITKSNEEEGIAEAMYTGPYLVPASEFGDISSYEIVELMYYSDNVLVDEDDEVVTDIEGTVGRENIRAFEASGENIFFIRNDAKERYYEILWDGRAHKDLTFGKLR